MEGNNNRLHLNFGTGNERLAPTDRTYPTTPSTFPQPVFPPPGQGGQQYTTNLQSPPQGPAYGGGYAPQGYFQSPYPQQYPAQQVNDYAHSQNAAGQVRSNTPGTNDPNTGLAQQFSHQNLAGAARGQQYNSRGPSPSAGRPRTAGSSGQPYNSYAHAPMPTQSAAPVSEFQPAPERNPDRYGTNANSSQKKCSQLAADFFKDSVKRARERNQR
jgi:protein-serine/threonine kinase